MSETILVLGASGQIGSELVIKLRSIYGVKKVIASDIRFSEELAKDEAPFEIIDATNKNDIKNVVLKYGITQVYQLVAMLSASGEKYPEKAWELNMTSLFNVLELAKEKLINRIFWPSSIAVFGPSTPKVQTPQETLMNPTTVYGISKLSGEFWCNYYFEKYGVDVRSLRYPGIISWKTKPGGGTTDYAVDIFFKAIEEGHYNCFLSENTRLPMMYMDDAVRATIDLMQADASNITIRTSYNLSAIDFTPEELAEEIKKIIPDFTIEYNPDFRQEIANSWPQTIDDSKAREDWNWSYQFDLELMVTDMINNLQSSKKAESSKL